MNKIPTQKENPNGLHAKFIIRKITGWRQYRFDSLKAVTVATEEGSEYFVLRLDEGGKDPEHIKACRIGVHAYADAIEHHLPELAKDLKERYPLL